MWSRLQPYVIILLLLSNTPSPAQTVLYCSSHGNRAAPVFELAGKTNDHYWVHTARRKRGARYDADPQVAEDHGFDIYDNRMNLVGRVPSFSLPGNARKQYFIAGNTYFDRLLLAAGDRQTMVLLTRYTSDGEPVGEERKIGDLPFTEHGNSFLLVRTEDKHMSLLLGFEPVPDASPRLHVLLFDQDWAQVDHKVYQHPSITQPLIQDDFTSYPIEHFTNAPVKIANNGQWLMAAPSRTNHNFLLFHFCNGDSSFSYKEIVLPSSSTLEDVAVSVNNEKGEAFAGILSTFHYSPLKNVQVSHYSLTQGAFDFDSSYRFNTQVAAKVKDENIVNESFIAVPGKGFMLMKEYGRPYTGWSASDTYDNQWDPEVLFANNAIPHSSEPVPLVKDGYVRYNTLSGVGHPHARGDLNLFYFPAVKNDSSWSGMISKEQVTELNTPNLSYLVMTANDKLFFLYNSFWRNSDLYASTTIIDGQGHELPGEGIVFSRFRNILNFQQARQVSGNEVAVPYEKQQGNGFAVIRF